MPQFQNATRDEGRFVVIGAGAFGAWTAYTLRCAGHEVKLLDQYGAANSRSSSGDESRIIRAGYGPDALYTKFAARALPLWERFFEQTGRSLMYRTGVLWLDRSDGPYVAGSVESLRQADVAFEKLRPEELRRRYPQIRLEPDIAALLEPCGGAILARQAIHAVVDEFARIGGVYRRARVDQPRGKDHLESIRTAEGHEMSGDAFVFACGPWLGKIFPELLGDRVIPSRQEVIFYGVPPGDQRFTPPQMPIWIDHSDPHTMYGFPDLDGRGFKVASDLHGEPFDPDCDDRVVSRDTLAAYRDYVATRFPTLANAPVIESRVCQYENTHNVDFLIDRHPEFDNVWLAGGGSGHGFKHGPAVGEYIAARLTDAETPAVEERFSLASKQAFDPETVASSL